MTTTRTIYSVNTSGCVSALLACMVALALVVAIAWAVIRLAFPNFDGMIGPGCDAGNSHCTFREWRKGCSDDDVRAHVCNLAEYRRRGGR